MNVAVLAQVVHAAVVMVMIVRVHHTIPKAITKMVRKTRSKFAMTMAHAVLVLCTLSSVDVVLEVLVSVAYVQVSVLRKIVMTMAHAAKESFAAAQTVAIATSIRIAAQAVDLKKMLTAISKTVFELTTVGTQLVRMNETIYTAVLDFVEGRGF
jgi:hypothetical protein